MKNPRLSTFLCVFFSLLMIPLLAVSDWTSFFNAFSTAASVTQSNTSTFKVLNTATGEVISMDAKDYVAGAVACEMPPTYPVEALKAQAVASYSYALYCQQQEKSAPSSNLKGADFSADFSALYVTSVPSEIKKKYQDRFDEYWGIITGAVDSVLGQKLTYNNVIALTPFFSVSSGKTESCKDIWQTDTPYLIAVDSHWDTSSPDFTTKNTFTLEEIENKCGDLISGGTIPSDLTQLFTDIQRTNSGSVTSMKIAGVPISGTDFRSRLSLRSSNFTVEYVENKFLITATGYGHGVGMSQYGARSMAAEGSSYTDILSHYFPGTVLETDIDIP